MEFKDNIKFFLIKKKETNEIGIGGVYEKRNHAEKHIITFEQSIGEIPKAIAKKISW